jgi:hypothetical protein
MNSLFQLEKNRKKAYDRYYSKQRELEKQRDAIEKQLSDMKYPHLLDYLKKLAKAALPKIKGAVGFETYGPFGLGNECSIYFYGPGTEKKRKTLAGATFTRYGDGYGLKDYSKNTGCFPKGSIGEMNGGNYNTIEITEKMTLDWFIKFAKKGYNK